MSDCGCRGSSSTGSDDGCGCPAADLVSVLERSARDGGSLPTFARPVNQASLGSVLATSTVAQDGAGGDPPGGGAGGPDDEESGGDGTEGEDPESDSESDEENFKDVPCIVAPQVWGCVNRSGECDPGVTEPDKRPHILWSDGQAVRLFNQFVAVLRLESVLDMMGSTPERACGTPDEHIRCGENRMIHAVIQNVGSTIPTPRLVEAALELAKGGAKDAATEKACEQPEDPSAPAREDCSKVKGREGEQYRDTWHCAFAVNLFDGELLTRLNAAWDEYAANERAQGRDDPGMSPIRDEGGGYYICAAAQVTWECESKDSPSEDPPESEPEPEPKPDPDGPGDGGVPQPREPEGRGGSETPPDPPPTHGCKKRDKDGKEVPDDGDGETPAKCCYKAGSGKATHCNNTGCWGKHQKCVPSADGKDCECLPLQFESVRKFKEWSAPEVEDKPPVQDDPKWNEDLEKEGKAGGGAPPGGGANGGTETGDDDPFGGDDERSERRSVTSEGALVSVEDDWRPPGGSIQSGADLVSDGAASALQRPTRTERLDTRPARPPAAVAAEPPGATIPASADPSTTSPSRTDRSIAHPVAW